MRVFLIGLILAVVASFGIVRWAGADGCEFSYDMWVWYSCAGDNAVTATVDSKPAIKYWFIDIVPNTTTSAAYDEILRAKLWCKTNGMSSNMRSKCLDRVDHTQNYLVNAYYRYGTGNGGESVNIDVRFAVDACGITVACLIDDDGDGCCWIEPPDPRTLAMLQEPPDVPRLPLPDWAQDPDEESWIHLGRYTWDDYGNFVVYDSKWINVSSPEGQALIDMGEGVFITSAEYFTGMFVKTTFHVWMQEVFMDSWDAFWFEDFGMDLWPN